MSKAMNTDIAQTIRQTKCAIGERMGRVATIKFFKYDNEFSCACKGMPKPTSNNNIGRLDGG